MNIEHPLLRAELKRCAELDLPYEKFRGATVAVTGAGGLVGSYLMHALDAVNRAHGLGLRLLAPSRSPERTRARLNGIEGISFPAYDATLAQGADFAADYIVHAASNAHPLAFSADPVGTMRANILGTLNLLENLRNRGGRLLFLSTGEIYGQNDGGIEAFDETHFGPIDPMNARACYPESKRAAEALCASYARQYDTDALAARLTYVYGPTITPDNSRADAQFLRCALKHQDIVLKSAGTQVRSYTYVADAAAAILTLLLRGERAQAYNVAHPQSAVSIRRYAETLAQIAGVNVIFDLPPETERAGYSTVARAVLNADKLTSLGWQGEYDLPTGLKHTYEISK